jgi:hypothetical protein
MKIVASIVNMSMKEYFGQGSQNAMFQKKIHMEAVYNILQIVRLCFGNKIYHILLTSRPVLNPLDNALWFPDRPR